MSTDRPSRGSRPATHRGKGEARRLSMLAIWGWPVALGLLTSIGLTAALFSDGGAGDLLAAGCLAIPVMAGVWFAWLRREEN